MLKLNEYLHVLSFLVDTKAELIDINFFETFITEFMSMLEDMFKNNNKSQLLNAFFNCNISTSNEALQVLSGFQIPKGSLQVVLRLLFNNNNTVMNERIFNYLFSITESKGITAENLADHSRTPSRAVACSFDQRDSSVQHAVSWYA